MLVVGAFNESLSLQLHQRCCHLTSCCISQSPDLQTDMSIRFYSTQILQVPPSTCQVVKLESAKSEYPFFSLWKLDQS